MVASLPMYVIMPLFIRYVEEQIAKYGPPHHFVAEPEPMQVCKDPLMYPTTKLQSAK